jgi:hypothetical protein
MPQAIPEAAYLKICAPVAWVPQDQRARFVAAVAPGTHGRQGHL